MILALPTETEAIEAFQQAKMRPAARIFNGYTSRGDHCGCALSAVARARGLPISNSLEALNLFGEDSKRFMEGWDYPYLSIGEYHSPISLQGAMCWWACVRAGLVPDSYEIANSSLENAPDWVLEQYGT